MDRHVAEDNILVSYFKYFIVFFDSILKIFLYLRRLFKFLPSVLSIIPATPQREPFLQGGRGLLFCCCLSGCHHSCRGAWGVRFLSFLLLPEDSNLSESLEFLLIEPGVVLCLPHHLHLLCHCGGVLQLGHEGLDKKYYPLQR
jgi:hypothetical protein